MIKRHTETYISREIGLIPACCPSVRPTSQVMAILRLCGPELGLSPQVLHTLEVLLSCLAPKRNHHVVFASNATLVSRAGGLSERSIRRHIAQLVEADLAERSDSANGKRYSRHDATAGLTLRFGLDFSKLFSRLEGLETLAAEVEARQQRLHYLRCKLRASCQKVLLVDPEDATALAARNAARRKLPAEAYEAMLALLPTPTETSEVSDQTSEMATSGGQNDRHQSNLSKEHIELEQAPDIGALLDHCTEAQSFAPNKICNAEDLIRHAENLAPMIGITDALWQSARTKQAPIDLAASVWMILQNLHRILKPAAYFRSITIGQKSAGFSPWEWMRRSIGINCPRTIG